MPIAAKVAVNTTLATGAGGLTCLFFAVFNGNPGDIAPLLNGACVCVCVHVCEHVCVAYVGVCGTMAAGRQG
jgi:ammonia channel protein AmtB